MGKEPQILSRNLRMEAWDKTGGRCWYCGVKLNPWKTFCVDHVVPQSEGGGPEVENLVPSCKVCNEKKGIRSVEEFRSILATVDGKFFTADQIDFLKSEYGIDLSYLRADTYVFYFERMQNTGQERVKINTASQDIIIDLFKNGERGYGTIGRKTAQLLERDKPISRQYVQQVLKREELV